MFKILKALWFFVLGNILIRVEYGEHIPWRECLALADYVRPSQEIKWSWTVKIPVFPVADYVKPSRDKE